MAAGCRGSFGKVMGVALLLCLVFGLFSFACSPTVRRVDESEGGVALTEEIFGPGRTDGFDATFGSCQGNPVERGIPTPLLERSELLSTRRNAWGSSYTWLVEANVPATASVLLGEYGSEGTYELGYSGYLDFLERVWGCVVIDDCGRVGLALVDGRSMDVFAGDEGDFGPCSLTLVWLG